MDIKIEKNEVLRYLGQNSNVSDKLTDLLIDKCIKEIKIVASPKSQYKVFDIKIINEDEIQILDSILTLKGKDIIKHLQYSKKIALMAATLGIRVDQRIKYYSNFNLTTGVIFDACANAYVEAVCDDLEMKIQQVADKSGGFKLTFRYSPGYGDFSLSIQHDLLKVLNSSKIIGLTVSPDHVLLPSKSVTAIIGLEDISIEGDRSKVKKLIDNEKCKTCRNYKNCIYLQEGTFCEFRKENL